MNKQFHSFSKPTFSEQIVLIGMISDRFVDQVNFCRPRDDGWAVVQWKSALDGGECPVRAVRQESYSFKSLRPRRRIFTECLLSVIKRSQLYFYCPNLVKQFSGVKREEQQCRMGVGSVLGLDASESVALLCRCKAFFSICQFNRRMAPLWAKPSAATA